MKSHRLSELFIAGKLVEVISMLGESDSLAKTKGLFIRLFIILVFVTPIFPTAAKTNTAEVDADQTKSYFNLVELARLVEKERGAAIGRLASLADGDFLTGIDIGRAEDSAIVLDFGGYAPWLNTIVFYSHSALPVKITATTLYFEDTTIVATINHVEQTEELVKTVCTFEGTRVTSIHINIEQLGKSEFEVSKISEIEVFYAENDEDKIPNRSDVGTEWVQDYPSFGSCANPALSVTKQDAQSFARRLRDRLGWTWQFDYGNSDAFPSDFGTADNSFADYVDFSYFSGHGNEDNFWFSHPGCFLNNADCQGRWGNSDMEWIAISACLTLREGNNRTAWHGCFDRLHLMCGFHSISWDVNMGKAFARNLTGLWLGLGKRRIPAAWLDAARETHGGLPPPGPFVNIGDLGLASPVVIGESPENLKDYIHDAGPVSADALNDGNFHTLQTFVVPEKKGSRHSSIGSAVLLKTAYHSQMATGWSTAVDSTLLVNSRAATMPRLIVSPISVNEAFVNNLASKFCNYFGILCSGTVQYDSIDQMYFKALGAYELLVSARTGGWDLTRTDQYALPDTIAPIIPTGADAIDSASSFLGTMGLTPSGAVQRSSFHIKYLTETPAGPDSLKSWDLHVGAGYYRQRQGKYIIGPGANLEVLYGKNASIVKAFHGGWRSVTQGSTAETVSLQTALQDLMDSNGSTALTGVPIMDTLIVLQSTLGYFEPAWDTTVTELVIAWIVSGECIFQSDTNDCVIVLPAQRGFNCGDADGNHSVNISDVVLLINYVFSGGPAPNPLLSGDADCSSVVNISDGVFLINYIFAGGPVPCTACK